MAELRPGTYAEFNTSLGTFTIELFVDKTPKTCENFIGLAEGTKAFEDPETQESVTRPFYDGLIFHRVIAGFMLQGGCPLGQGYGGPGYQFDDEFDPELRHNIAGRLSMANAGPGTNGSQFFVTLAATPHLDNRHSVFGQVIDGMDIVNKIGTTATGAQDRPVEDVVMESVKIIRV